MSGDNSDPVVEILGVWLPNKGAELMAWTTVSELGKRLPKARFVSKSQGPADLRQKIGMPEYHVPPKSAVGNPANVTHRVDISGFAYGDTWGHSKAQDRAGKGVVADQPYYMAPQAFGPFRKWRLRRVMQKVVRGADRIYARDSQSLEHLNRLKTGRSIEQLPDITLSLNVEERPTPARPAPYGCLVPNRKAVTTKAFSEPALIALFVELGGALRHAEIDPVVVLHEPEADAELGQKIADKLGCEILKPDDARDLKRLIGASHIVASARFHGLVNGLSAGVPSFGIGWSHKYAELLSDFGMDGTFSNDKSAFLSRFTEYVGNADLHAETSSTLKGRAAQLAQQLDAFWDDLAEDIRRTSR